MRAVAWPRLWGGVGALLVALVIGLTLWPSQDGPVPAALSDKTGHVLAYFVLVLWYAGLYPRRRLLVLASGFFVMGVGLEWLQGFIDVRVSDVFDMVANAAGAVLGAIAARLGLDQWCHWTEALLGARG